MMRITALLATLAMLGGCDLLAGAETASTVVTGERLSDHVVSFASGKTCSTKRTRRGLTYCVEDEVIPNPNVHCYPTLGQVTCYDRDDPFGDGQQKVGENDHNLVKKR